MKFLALDMNLMTGWAYWEPGMPKARMGRWELGKEVKEEAERGSLRLRNRMREFATLTPLAGATVIIEAAKVFDRDNENRALWFLGVANEAATTALELGGSPRFQDSQTMKSWWFGHGNLRSAEAKRNSIAAARLRGRNPKCDNSADALGHLTCYLGFWKVEGVPWDCTKVPNLDEFKRRCAAAGIALE